MSLSRLRKEFYLHYPSQVSKTQDPVKDLLWIKYLMLTSDLHMRVHTYEFTPTYVCTHTSTTHLCICPYPSKNSWRSISSKSLVSLKLSGQNQDARCELYWINIQKNILLTIKDTHVNRSQLFPGECQESPFPFAPYAPNFLLGYSLYNSYNFLILYSLWNEQKSLLNKEILPLCDRSMLVFFFL